MSENKKESEFTAKIARSILLIADLEITNDYVKLLERLRECEFLNEAGVTAQGLEIVEHPERLADLGFEAGDVQFLSTISKIKITPLRLAAAQLVQILKEEKVGRSLLANKQAMHTLKRIYKKGTANAEALAALANTLHRFFRPEDSSIPTLTARASGSLAQQVGDIITLLVRAIPAARAHPQTDFFAKMAPASTATSTQTSGNNVVVPKQIAQR